MDRMLRLLASHWLLKSSLRGLPGDKVERLYGLNPTAKLFVKKGNEGSMSHRQALPMHPATQKVWLHFKDAIMDDGNRFNKVHDIAIFEYMGVDPAYIDIVSPGFVDELEKLVAVTLRLFLVMSLRNVLLNHIK
ncbi:hypothetical protein MLD38_011111 [Melastoma candidum]|uniref:Uncharacterized protein n=1 Tax=Melastoma candidum TaxID=119954 RepID=A0ACB9R3C0_9MYRT|nr:hypothetical protein MLD38_011111 [Melastoma candidum]